MESRPDIEESRPDAKHCRGEVLRHRDLMVLKWLGEQYAARVDHLEALIGRGKRTVHDMLWRLRDAGHVRTRQILVGERMWATPTSAGLRACGLNYREMIPRSMNLAHIAAVNDVRLHVQRQRPAGVWVCERQVAIEYPRVGPLPDAVFLLEGHPVAIEVELTPRAAGISKTKLDKLERSFDGALYYCAPVPYRRLSALKETGRHPKLQVRELPKRGAPRP